MNTIASLPSLTYRTLFESTSAAIGTSGFTIPLAILSFISFDSLDEKKHPMGTKLLEGAFWISASAHITALVFVALKAVPEKKAYPFPMIGGVLAATIHLSLACLMQSCDDNKKTTEQVLRLFVMLYSILTNITSFAALRIFIQQRSIGNMVRLLGSTPGFIIGIFMPFIIFSRKTNEGFVG
ncbi:MAG: hypothetical protein LVR00_02855 [Rhabdochlamydiaceae bacterium]|jgi:hypothetical protein